MINVEQLRELIILPALSKLQMYSDVARELLVFTCAAETNGGTYLKQIKGPALGIFQMEPRTYNDLWATFIRGRSNILMIMSGQFDAYRIPDEMRMVYDLQFAAAMARLFYKRVTEPLPEKIDPELLWEYYKKYWNTEAGKAKKEKCIKAYLEYSNPQ